MAEPLREAGFWEPLEGRRLRCGLCPRRCELGPGAEGACRVRLNEGGRLVLPYFGAVSSLAVDPIEKKPLHHFLPGSSVFSAGFLGCNLRCPFCQNWQISQSVEAQARTMSPAELVAEARASGCPSIAFTYSEPIVHAEFVLESMRLARAAGLRTVLVTNGCASPEAARELLPLTDAANVDLKCWSGRSYREILRGELEAVLDFIRLAAGLCRLEVTTLVVPGLSDAPEDVGSIAAFLAGISPDLPLHLSAYHPAWKHRAPPTGASALLELAEAARRRLRYVYVGNLSGGHADSRCHSCGDVVVRRRGYEVDAGGLARGPDGGARCSSCGAELPFYLGSA